MIPSAARYDHFDTLPYFFLHRNQTSHEASGKCWHQIINIPVLYYSQPLAIIKIHDYNGFVNIKTCEIVVLGYKKP